MTAALSHPARGGSNCQWWLQLQRMNILMTTLWLLQLLPMLLLSCPAASGLLMTVATTSEACASFNGWRRAPAPCQPLTAATTTIVSVWTALQHRCCWLRGGPAPCLRATAGVCMHAEQLVRAPLCLKLRWLLRTSTCLTSEHTSQLQSCSEVTQAGVAE
jgi:hypothetical protein